MTRFTAVGLSLAMIASLRGATDTTLPTIQIADNEEAAGTLENGVLLLELEIQRGMWYPLGSESAGTEVLAFAEAGRAPQIPGPMVRVPLGTEIRATIRNPLEVPVVVHGLTDRQRTSMDSLLVPAGGTAEAAFRADHEGTFYYYGTTGSDPRRWFETSHLVGALLVASPGTPITDEVMVLGIHHERAADGTLDASTEVLTINGRPWPHTKRLEYELGDSVRWRLINYSERVHPMHLHGFFFRVDARGDVKRDTLYWTDQQRMAVTELMQPGTTLQLAWSPDRPGGWVFHCHLNFHVVPNGSFDEDRPTAFSKFQRLLSGHHDGDPNNHVVEAMGGLMMGIYVNPPPGWVPNEPKRRQLRLFIQRDSTEGDRIPQFGYVLQRGDAEPEADSLELPGSLIVLREGEPTAITVVNRTDEPSQIHWHGLEIESYFDGVTGVGGYPGMRTPSVLPNDSFEMRITPPRAGSYMYHTHVDDIRQQGRGLYGPIIVLDEGEDYDPEHDRVVMLSNFFPTQGVLINGTATPPDGAFRVGETYRFRLMNITLGNPGVRVRLTQEGMPVQWIPVAKDGFDLPSHLTDPVLADQAVSIGDIYDFSFTPRRPGELALEARSGNGRLFASQRIVVDGPSPGQRPEN